MKTEKEKSTIHKIVYGSIFSLFIAIILFTVPRYIKEHQDRDRCHGMLNHGQWASDKFEHWSPSGCLSQQYNSKELGICLGNSRILYIGDSIMREQFYAMAGIVGFKKPEQDAIHEDQTYHAKKQNLTVDLWWDPYLNTTRTLMLLNGTSTVKPNLLIMGTGVWFMRRTGQNYLELWKTSVDRVFDAVSVRSIADKALFTPIEILERSMLNEDRLRLLTTEKITLMNNYLKDREPRLRRTVTPFSIPFVWNEIVTTSKNQTSDGLHFHLPVTSAQAQLALNYRCNNDPAIKTLTYPFDTTCCYTYPKPLWYQYFIFILLFLLVSLGFVLYYLPSGRLVDSISLIFPSEHKTLMGLLIFSLSVMYMYLGDRTQLFAKMEKNYNLLTFIVLCSVTLLLGCGTLSTNEKHEFLNRDQTDEWKGWMQLVILIYHVVGATTVASIYNPVRVLVAAYLFQTGYGHFFFFYKKADFGVARVLSILVRLNLLTVVLAYTMKTDYLFYYFSPLVTFWFGVIWITMRILPSRNHQAAFVLFKIGLMSVLTGAIIHAPGVLEFVFKVMSLLFKTDWNVTSWRFRLALDAWIVYIGMLSALATIKLDETRLTDHYPRIWTATRAVASVLSLLGLVGFFLFEIRQTKASYTPYHPYISWIPILSFVVLRNVLKIGRRTHSRFFAWVGKMSLETYIGQFHMWLAADTHGILVLLPTRAFGAGWYLNVFVSTVVFFFVCHHLSQATGWLTQWICAGAKKTTTVVDEIALLPTAKVQEEQEALLNESSTKAEEDDWSDEPLPQPRFAQRLCNFVLNSYWIRSGVCLIALGVFNRFCSSK